MEVFARYNNLLSSFIKTKLQKVASTLAVDSNLPTIDRSEFYPHLGFNKANLNSQEGLIICAQSRIESGFREHQ